MLCSKYKGLSTSSMCTQCWPHYICWHCCWSNPTCPCMCMVKLGWSKWLVNTHCLICMYRPASFIFYLCVCYYNTRGMHLKKLLVFWSQSSVADEQTFTDSTLGRNTCSARMGFLFSTQLTQHKLGVHDMQQASCKAESSNHKHAVNDM